MVRELDKKRDMRVGNDEERYTKTINIIMNFLTEKPSSTLGEIFKEFQRTKLTYTKTRINKILRKLEENLEIKNTQPKGKNPKYAIIDTSDFTIKRDSYAFKDEICASTLSFNVTQE